MVQVFTATYSRVSAVVSAKVSGSSALIMFPKRNLGMIKNERRGELEANGEWMDG